MSFAFRCNKIVSISPGFMTRTFGDFVTFRIRSYLKCVAPRITDTPENRIWKYSKEDFLTSQDWCWRSRSENLRSPSEKARFRGYRCLSVVSVLVRCHHNYRKICGNRKNEDTYKTHIAIRAETYSYRTRGILPIGTYWFQKRAWLEFSIMRDYNHFSSRSSRSGLIAIVAEGRIKFHVLKIGDFL